MKINSAFPSDYIKSSDLGAKRVGAIIDKVTVEKVGEDQKPVVWFVGKEKGLVLNKTNANMIAEIAGTDETDDWTDIKIVMYVAKVDYQGRRVDAIRVDYPADRQPPKVIVDDGSDDIPF